MITIATTGGRNYWDSDRVWNVLNAFHGIVKFNKLIHGDASGADHCCEIWAEDYMIEHERFEANWKQYGLAAGPLRNQEMIDEEPDYVIAFPGGSGTADMVRRAERSRIPVIKVAA